MKPLVHQRVHSGGLEHPIGFSAPGPDSGEYLNPLLQRSNRHDVKFARSDRLDHVVTQHQIFHVFRWNHHTLAPSEPRFHAAHVEKTFNLLIDAANWLNVALLAY